MSSRFVVQHDQQHRRNQWHICLEVNRQLVSWVLEDSPPTSVDGHQVAHLERQRPAVPDTTRKTWDVGRYENLLGPGYATPPRTMRDALSEGLVEVSLHGRRLHGRYAFVHRSSKTDAWLLIKLSRDLGTQETPNTEVRPGQRGRDAGPDSSGERGSVHR